MDISGQSLLGENPLKALRTTNANLAQALVSPIVSSDQNAKEFQSASFTATFEKPSIALEGNTVDAKANVNSTISVKRTGDKTLFGDDDYDPVPIENGDCWVSFELETVLDATVNVPLPNGFGVSFEGSTAPDFATYVRIPGAQSTKTTLKDAVQQTLNSFNIMDSPDEVLRIPNDVIYTSDVEGSATVGGSWALPLSINQYSLANASLPFSEKISVAPAVTLSLAGSFEVSSEFNVRMRKIGTNTLHMGVYQKPGKEISVTFTAGAGLGANLGGTDLISAFLAAIAPDLNLGNLSQDQISSISDALKASISHQLGVQLTAAWSNSRSNEAAIAYNIDISTPNAQTKAAIAGALAGDWRGLAGLPNAKVVAQGVQKTVETKGSVTFNFLGLYNSTSVSDFVKTMTTITGDDGSVTFTDKATATRIQTGNTFENLRKALYEGFSATAVYQAVMAGVGASPTLKAQQNLFLYKASMKYSDALKALNAGEVLGVMPASVKTGLPQHGAAVKHALFSADRKYAGNDVLRFFFSDIRNLVPRKQQDLSATGRKVLVQLLDPQEDARRIAALEDDDLWAQWDAAPASVPGEFHPDWASITWWAAAIAKVAPLLAKAIGQGSRVAGNPSLDPTFLKERSQVISALEEAGKNAHAAFDPAWGICVMSALAGNGTLVAADSSAPTFNAEWNGQEIFPVQKPAAVGPAVKIATVTAVGRAA